MRIRLTLAILAVLTAIACDGEPMMVADAVAVADAIVDAPPDGGGTVVEMDRPAPPSTTCPPAWRESESGCEPWPESGRATCAADEAHFPGAEGCERLGPPCPTGEWPEGLDPADTIYVRASDPPASGGDGSMGAPFLDLVGALEGAAAGRTVALGRGRHALPRLARISAAGVRIVGACVRETVVVSRQSTTLFGIGGDAELRVENLTVEGEDGNGVSAAGTLVLRDVVLSDMVDYAIGAGTLDAERVVVRGLPSGASAAIVLFGDASLTQVIVEDAGGAVFTGDGVSSVSIASSVFADVRGPFAYRFADVLGAGARFELDVDIDVSATVIADMPRALDSTARSMDFVIRRSALYRSALVAAPPNTLAGEALFVRDPVGAGISVSGSASSVTLRDLWVGGGERAGSGVGGHALRVLDGATVSVERLRVVDSLEAAVLVDGPGSSLTLADLVVRGTRATEAGLFGRAIQVQRGGRLDLARAELTDNRELALGVFDDGGRVDAIDVRVADTRERDCAAAGCAAGGVTVGAYEGGALELRRFVIDGAALAGVQVGPDGEIDLSDGLIRRCPVGANVQPPGYDVSRLSERVVFEDNETNLDSAALPLPSETVEL